MTKSVATEVGGTVEALVLEPPQPAAASNAVKRIARFINVYGSRRKSVRQL
jgi:hypothetical protein